MLFNSVQFLLFFAVVFGAYTVAPPRWRLALFLVSSLYFYGSWNVLYLPLLVGSGLLDYSVALVMERSESPRARKRLMLLSLASNLGVLALFKYYNFFRDSVTDVAGTATFLPASDLLLPLGISFYTFQTLSYTIDVYRGQLRAERNPLRVLVYVTFFPQLVAGPIVRASDFLPQLDLLSGPRWDNVVDGARRFLIGLLKKIVLADNLALLVNPVYAAPDSYSALWLLLATYAFAWQIFFDFSGYSDMAIGLAKMFNIRFLENFSAPYISASIQEFWRRWHISLSSWLRDYLYVPLGGNRGGRLLTYRNLFLTMLLGGLWHGASYNFIIWGAIHGVWLGLERFYTRDVRGLSPIEEPPLHRRLGAAFLVFHGVCLTWIFFRAQTLEDAWSILTGILGGAAGGGLSPFEVVSHLMAIGAGAATLGLCYAAGWRYRRAWYAVIPLALVVLALFGRSSQEFIYFVF